MIYIAITLTILCIFSIANFVLAILFLTNRNTSKAPTAVAPPAAAPSLSEEELLELKRKKEAEDKAFEELMGYNAAVAYGISKKKD